MEINGKIMGYYIASVNRPLISLTFGFMEEYNDTILSAILIGG